MENVGIGFTPSLADKLTQYFGLIDVCPSDRHPFSMQSGRIGGHTNNLLVAIVDDDEAVRESLPDLLREFGFLSHAYSSAEEFLASDGVDQTKCLILDIAMAGMTGLALQRELKACKRDIPIVFITGTKDEAVRAQAFQQGAVAVLLKPFSDTALLDALNAALQAK